MDFNGRQRIFSLTCGRAYGIMETYRDTQDPRPGLMIDNQKELNMASKFWKAFNIDVERGLIEIEFFDGSKETLDVNAQSVGNRTAAMWHGYTQKIRDGAAVTVYEGEGDNKTARPGNPDEKKSGVLSVLDTLRKGAGDVVSWNARTGSAEKERGGLDVMTDALVAYYESVGKNFPADKIREKLKGMSQKARVAFITQPAILPFYQAQTGEAAVPSADDFMA